MRHEPEHNAANSKTRDTTLLEYIKDVIDVVLDRIRKLAEQWYTFDGDTGSAKFTAFLM